MPSLAHFVFFLVALSVASTSEFTTIYRWEDMDFSWPSEANRTRAIQNETFKPGNIWPLYMAIHNERIFFSLAAGTIVPATLVSLPTSSASSVPPKLDPFPNWNYHDRTNCSNIQRARGMRVDANGHLWVLDAGDGDCCKAKLLIFDLADEDKNVLVHQFAPSVYGNVKDLVLDQTPDNSQLAYITEGADHVIGFSRKTNQSWVLKTPGKFFFGIAKSPLETLLYLSEWTTRDVYSISTSDVASADNRSATMTYVGAWKGESAHIMLIDNANIMYATFDRKDYVSTWNVSQPFSEQRFYEGVNLGNYWPFTFALDASGTLWMTKRNYNGGQPRHTLLKAAAVPHQRQVQ